jgi:hypothetical protein
MVSADVIVALVDRYLDDPQFRDAFARDPEAAVRAAGFQLDEEHWAALHAADGLRLSEALKRRSSYVSFGLGAG